MEEKKILHSDRAADDPSLDGTAAAHPAFWRGVWWMERLARWYCGDNIQDATKDAEKALIGQQMSAPIPKKDGE